MTTRIGTLQTVLGCKSMALLFIEPQISLLPNKWVRDFATSAYSTRKITEPEYTLSSGPRPHVHIAECMVFWCGTAHCIKGGRIVRWSDQTCQRKRGTRSNVTITTRARGHEWRWRYALPCRSPAWGKPRLAPTRTGTEQHGFVNKGHYNLSFSSLVNRKRWYADTVNAFHPFLITTKKFC